MFPTSETTAESTTTIRNHQQISEIIVTEVADTKDVDPLSLEPLFNVVDPDALNTLFTSADRSSLLDIKVSFSFEGCKVVVHGGNVTVTQLTENDTPSTTIVSH